jgi:hypothetical protein
VDVYNELTAQIDTQLAAFARIKSDDLAAFNRDYASRSMPVIIPR